MKTTVMTLTSGTLLLVIEAPEGTLLLSRSAFGDISATLHGRPVLELTPLAESLVPRRGETPWEAVAHVASVAERSWNLASLMRDAR